MLLSMTTVAFATNWETPIDFVQVASVGNDVYASLDEAFDAAAGKQVSLTGDLTVGALVMPADSILNLNGYTLTADAFDSTAAEAEIIDTTDGDGLLSVKGECKFAHNNPQLPIEDKTAGGFRFFEVEVKSVAITGKNSTSPKY